MKNGELWAVAFCVLLLAAIISFSPGRYCYDEPFHMAVVQNVRETGWKAALASPANQSAVGPLYAAIHLLAAPLTGGRAPGVRWVNFLCLAVVVAVLTREFKDPSTGNCWIPA